MSGRPPLRIGLFGGTFDPVHRGHLGIAQRSLEALDLDRVHFLPCRQSPHKPDQATSASFHRLAMLRLATAGLDWAVVDPFELSQPLPSYSWRTAEAFAQSFPEAELYWIMGTDQWQALERWNQWQRLAELVHFIVFQRGDFPEPRPGVASSFLRGNFPISATSLRNGHDSPLAIPEVSHYREQMGLT